MSWRALRCRWWFRSHRVIVTWQGFGPMRWSSWSPCTRCGTHVAPIKSKDDSPWWNNGPQEMPTK